MPYDVEILFTSILVSENIDYIIKEICKNKVIKPMCKGKLIFHRLLETRYIDDTITKRKQNATNDELFANMNSHHKNKKLTIATNPTRFLDTAFNVNPDGSVTTKVYKKLGTLGTTKVFKILELLKLLELSNTYKVQEE